MDLSQETEAIQLEECKLAQQRLTMQYAVSSILIEASTIDEAAGHTLHVIGEGQGWQVGNFWLLDAQASVLHCNATWHVFSSTATSFEITSQQMQFTQGVGLPGRVWATGEPVWISNVQEDSNFPRFKLAQRADLHGAFAFPIRGSSGFLGVIEFFSSEIRSPDEELTRTVMTIGNQVGQFIEKKRTEEDHQRLLDHLEAEHARLEAVLRQMPAGVILAEAPSGKLILGNEQMEQIWRQPFLPSADISQYHDYKGFHENGRPYLPEEWPLARSITTGEFVEGEEVDILRGDGTIGVTSVSSAPIRNREGHIVAGVVVFHDITERRQLEQRTHEALEGLLKLAGLLISGTERAYEAEDIQKRSPSRMLSEESKVGHQLVELTCNIVGCQRASITALDPHTSELRSVAVTGISPEQEREWRARHPGSYLSQMFQDGPALSPDQVCVIDMTQPPFRDYPNPYGIQTMLLAPMCVEDQLVGLLALDYGEARHEYTEEEIVLTATIAKLAALVIERERLLQQRAEARANELSLREANRRMDEFLSIASHELRSPLTSIKGNIQLTQRRLKAVIGNRSASTVDDLDKLEMAYTLLERAEQQMRVLNRLVNDLIDISRIQAGKLDLQIQPRPCDLASIVKEVVQEQRKLHLERTIRLEVSPQEPVPVVADVDRIGQVVTNYLTNALKYSTVERPVDVSLQVESGRARVAVRDEGPGLSLEEQERIWERFYQAENIDVQTGSSVGLGLGLYISKTIIERHHGQAGVQSSPGAGSTFWFMLPLAK